MSTKTAIITVAAMIVATFGGLAIWLSNNKDGTDDPNRAPAYRVIKDKLEHDDINRTQISLSVAIEERVTEQKVRDLIEHLYQETSQRGPFKARDRADYIWLYIYARNDQSMIAHAYKIPMDDQLVVNIRQELLATINDPPVDKFGISESERFTIWQNIVLAERRATNEAEAKYPYLKSSTPNYTTARDNQQLDRMVAYDDQLTKKYKLDLASAKGLTLEQLGAIGHEGVNNSWITPDFPVKPTTRRTIAVAPKPHTNLTTAVRSNNWSWTVAKVKKHWGRLDGWSWIKNSNQWIGTHADASQVFISMEYRGPKVAKIVSCISMNANFAESNPDVFLLSLTYALIIVNEIIGLDDLDKRIALWTDKKLKEIINDKDHLLTISDLSTIINSHRITISSPDVGVLMSLCFKVEPI